MGYINAKIYRLKTVTLLFLLFILHTTLLAQDKIELYRLTFPFYQENSVLPVLILRCERAKPIGVRIEMEGVRLDWIGNTIDDIKGVVTTPSAVYDKSTQQITGNEKIEYRSPVMDLYGVGFDMDQVKQNMHIRSKVKVVLKEQLKHERGQPKKLNTGKISMAKSLKNMKLERIDDGKKDQAEDNELKKEIEEERGGSFDWAALIWFFVLVIGTVVIIKILMRKKNRNSGKNARD